MKRLSKFLIVFLFCQTVRVVHAAPKSRATQEDDIREAAFRFQFRPYLVASSPKQDKRIKAPRPTQVPKDRVSPFKVYFLSLGNDKDPSDKLIKRFAGHKPPIKKVSQSYIDSESKDAETSGLWVRDKKTKEIGLIYTVSSIRWLSKNKVAVEGGYFGGGLFATSNTYTLRRKGENWKVTHIKFGPVA